jgi:stage V sporulation protein AC
VINVTNKEYQEFIKSYTPKSPILINAITTFIAGGLIGAFSELLLELYSFWFNMPRKESGVMVILTLIVVASILTAFGIFDIFVTKLKSALIIPITGFAHSITSAALEYRTEGLVLGIGANIFKLAGTVILYGTVAVYVFGIIRLLLMGG